MWLHVVHLSSSANQAVWDSVADSCASTIPLDFVRATLASESGRILDVGCGYGRAAVALGPKSGLSVFGIDSSIKMLGRAQREGAALLACAAAAEFLPFADGTFDAALLIGVLSSITTPQGRRSAVTETRRVLRPGGLLLLSDFALSLKPLYLFRYIRGLTTLGHEAMLGTFVTSEGLVIHHFRRSELADLLDGFRIRTIVRRKFQTMHGHMVPGYHIACVR
jgi:SAM-dependent methyltransferase